MRDAALRLLRFWLTLLAVAAGVASCSSRKQDENVTGGATAPAAPPVAPVDAARPPDCAKDDDCLPLNCCFATQPDSCVPRATARCDKVAVQCQPYNGTRYSCSCDKGACIGTLVPGSEVVPDAGTDEKPGWATGALKQQAVLDVIMQHGPDVKACRATAKKPSGTVVVRWTVLASGAVERATVAASSVSSPTLPPCLAKKIAKWRFPKAKGPTQVSYAFQFRT